VLLRLYDEGSCLKTNLQSIVKNLYSLDRLLEALKSDGLIMIEKKPFGKNIQEISLTDEGKRVALQLKGVDEPLKGITPEFFNFQILKFIGSHEPCTPEDIEKAFKNAYEILDILKKEGLIYSEINKEVYPQVFNIGLTEKGKLVLRNLERLDRYLVEVPEGLLKDIQNIIVRDKTYTSVEEFVNSAVRSSLEKWKRDHAVG
jgi:predicted transcriptional regulator